MDPSAEPKTKPSPNDSEPLRIERMIAADEIDDGTMRDEEILEDMGEDFREIVRQSPAKRAIFELIYHPRTEISIFVLIILSVSLLIMEVSLPAAGTVSWLFGFDVADVSVWLYWTDIVITSIFVVEYLTKLWLAPKKWYFIKANWIDLLAILPILRVFRIGRAVRLLRLLRLLRLVRVGQIMSQRLLSVSGEIQRRSVENVIIFVYLFFSLVFGSVGILVFEKGHKSGFETLADGLWWCVVTLTTVGYGDKYPVTFGGKVVAAIIMFIGLSFYALLTGVLSSILIERSKRQEGQGMDILNLVGHVVICNWNDHAMRLVDDLRQANAKRKIVVLCKDDTIPQVVDQNIHYVFKDPTTQDGLETARVGHAEVVVVLAAQAKGESAQDADARSILSTLAIEKMNPRIHSIVELLNEENVFHVKNAGVDEVIVSGAYTGTMLSQSVQFPGVSDVFSDMFRSGEGSRMSQEPIPKPLVGKRFSQAFTSLFEQGQGVLIGYRRGPAVEVSPPEDVKLQAGDFLVMMKRVE